MTVEINILLVIIIILLLILIFAITPARNMTRAGVTETVAMSITGHKTPSMFQRYNITSSDDKRKALIATQEHIKSLSTVKKVISIQDALPRN